MSDPLNSILLDVHQYSTANAPFPVTELRQHADFVADKIGEARAERELLIYWLLRAYQSGHREGWEAAPSVGDTMEGILHTLANLGYDPNLSAEAKELVQLPAAHHVAQAQEKWAKKG